MFVRKCRVHHARQQTRRSLTTLILVGCVGSTKQVLSFNCRSHHSLATSASGTPRPIFYQVTRTPLALAVFGCLTLTGGTERGLIDGMP